METQETLNGQNYLMHTQRENERTRERERGKITIQEFKVYYRAVVIIMVWYWYKNREDQWNGVETLEVSPHKYN